MEFIQDLLKNIYDNITLPIIKFIANTPLYLSKFILFLLYAAVGYIIGRIIDFFARIVLSYIELDKFVKEKKLEKVLFNTTPSDFIRKLLRYYIYLYFIAIGISNFGIELSLAIKLLNMAYILIIIVSIGFVIAGLIEKLLRNITRRETLIFLSKGLVIYIFFVWGLEIIGLPTSIFQLVLNVFLVSIAISLGISLGVLIVLENRDILKKMLLK